MYIRLFIGITLLFSCVHSQYDKAIVHLNTGAIIGAVIFTQTNDGVEASGKIFGLEPGIYGFHIHELGDTSDCLATGAHFNPHDTTHGGRDHDVRHVGDLGNIEFTEDGVAEIDFLDKLISLNGINSIIGRSLVLHENEDDLGLGNHVDSLSTGNAGGRLACGVIGILNPVYPLDAEPL